MQRVLAKFGITQVARTGKISLKRGDDLLEMGGWGDASNRERAKRQNRANNGANPTDSSQNGAAQQEGSDVYAIDSNQTGEARTAFVSLNIGGQCLHTLLYLSMTC